MTADMRRDGLTAVILQPCLFPWRGQFDLFSRADVRIFLDDVQFSKGTWYNRNRIMTTSGSAWITVPIQKKGSLQTLIRDMAISDKQNWQGKILGQIFGAYRKAPYFRTYYPDLERFVCQDWEFISDISRSSVTWGFERLGRPMDFLLSSSLGIGSGNPTDRLIQLCRKVGAARYLSGPAAKSYMGDGEAFSDAGIELIWMEYPNYPSYRDDAEGEMSILDLLFRVGPDAPRYIWGEGR